MTTSAPVPMPEEHQSSSHLPAAIRPEHKKKFAVIYLRQSAFDQVRNKTGARESHWELATLAADWGWPPELILVIEEDLGLSGTSSSQQTGLQRIEGMLNRGEVGLVMVRDASRLSRNPYDRQQFLRTVFRAGALLVSPDEPLCPGAETTKGTS